MIRHNCAVCGSLVILDECNVCDSCEWEQDTVQEDDPNYRGGANSDSLNERKAWWAKQSKTQKSAQPA